MNSKMLGYIERYTPIHQLTGLTKLIVFLIWSTIAMLTYDTRILLFLFIAGVAIFPLAQIHFSEIKVVILLILAFLLLNTIAIYVFSPQEGVNIYSSKTILWHGIGRYNLTIEQLFYLLNITLKYISVLPIALLFLLTTHPSEFAASLNKMGISYKIGISVSLALRYIPDIQRDFKTIQQVAQARGVDYSRNAKLTERIKHAAQTMLPLIFSSLERIEVVSNAMELRSFGKHKTRTWYSERQLSKWDKWIITISIIFLLVSIMITFQDGSRYWNPFM